VTGYLRIRYKFGYKDLLTEGIRISKQSAFGRSLYADTVVAMLKKMTPVKEFKHQGKYVALFPMDFRALQFFRYVKQHDVTQDTVDVIEEAA
jgi:hypothetical protein